MKKFGFVILHYLSIELTEKCINSIIEFIDTNEYEIIVVDNASPNNTGKELKEKYNKTDKITVLINQENIGYSAGNNVGIKYAVENLKCDFIVVLNNDTRVIQKDFTQVILDEYERSHFAALGPQVFDPDNRNDSNPVQGNPPLDLVSAKAWYKMWRKQYIKLIFGLYNFHLKKESVSDNVQISNDIVLNRHEDVILHGCCLVLSPVYLKKFDGLAEFSFMYLEEPALLFRLRKNNMLSVYNPNLKIFHEEAASTKLSSQKEKVRIKRMLDASKGLYNFFMLTDEK